MNKQTVRIALYWLEWGTTNAYWQENWPEHLRVKVEAAMAFMMHYTLANS